MSATIPTLTDAEIIKALRDEKNSIIKRHNKHVETITALRAENAALVRTIKDTRALVNIPADPAVNAPVVVVVDPANIRQVTIVNIMKYYCRKTWEAWGTNPHQAPAYIFGMGVFLLFCWLTGTIAMGTYKALRAGSEWPVHFFEGFVGAFPALVQTMLYFYPPVRARF